MIVTLGSNIDWVNYLRNFNTNEATIEERETSLRKVIRMEKFIIHPDYDSSLSDFDLALVKLSKPVEFSRHIQPICLPESKCSQTPPSRSGSSFVDGCEGNVTAIGWGLTENNLNSNSVKLRKVELTVPKQNSCGIDPYKMYYNVPWKICAGEVGSGSDTCRGDSGSPLVCIQNDGSAYLLGVTSHGWPSSKPCPSPPGYYTR